MRRKEATRIRWPREEHTQEQGKIKRSGRAWPTARKTRSTPTAAEKTKDPGEDGKDSKSDTEESVAKSKAETMPKKRNEGYDKTEGTADIDTQTMPWWQNWRWLGRFEQSRKSGPNEERKMMEADVQGVSQATTMAVGSTPTSVCSGGAAELMIKR